MFYLLTHLKGRMELFCFAKLTVWRTCPDPFCISGAKVVATNCATSGVEHAGGRPPINISECFLRGLGFGMVVAWSCLRPPFRGQND